MNKKENKSLFVWMSFLMISIILEIILMYDIGITMSIIVGLVIILLSIWMAKLEEMEKESNDFCTEKIIVVLTIVIVVIKILRMNP